MIEIGEARRITQRAVPRGDRFEMGCDRIGGQLAVAMDGVVERAREQAVRLFTAGQPPQRGIEMQGAVEQDVGRPLARVLGIDETEMDLAFVPQAGLRDRLGSLIEQIDLASARCERKSSAGPLDAGAKYRNRFADRTPPT